MRINFKNYQNQPRCLDLTTPQIMAILNITPDSFFDGGKFFNVSDALFRVEKMLSEGADIIDIGGESTRPNAVAVSLQEELDRVIPVIEAIRKNFDCLISIDSYKSEVFKQAYQAGVDIINDVTALQGNGSLEIVAKMQIPVCLMHLKGDLKTMQQNTDYHDLLEEVADFFNQRLIECNFFAIDPRLIILDPGFGFSKTLEQNYLLLKNLELFTQNSFPVLVGVSRKSMIQKVLNKPASDCLCGSISANVIALQKGAKILRVHDVKETAQAIKIWQNVQNATA